jgi:hypothetical protein
LRKTKRLSVVCYLDQVLQVDRDRLLTGALEKSEVQRYGTADGLQGVEGVRRERSVVADSLGRVWGSLNRGLILRDSAPVKVPIESISASKYLRMMVRDDGCGIDSQVLDAGRQGHWGLSDMRERSEGIGASLRLLNRIGAGTAFELTVPSAIAFEGQSRGSVSHWLTWFSRKKFEPQSGARRKRGK